MPRASTPKALRTRAKMLQVTAEIISREGYAAWSEEYVCTLCECTRGALRYQFPEGKYDLLPAFVASTLQEDAQMLASLGDISPRDRMYLILHSLHLRPPSPATLAMLEISLAARGDARLYQSINPLLESANAQVLGLTPSNTDPELLALRCLLHGISLAYMQKNTPIEHLAQSIEWLLAQLPTPAHLPALLQRILDARASQSGHSST